MKEYNFIYTDLEGNFLQEKKFDCYNNNDAMEMGTGLMCECNVNECWIIEVRQGNDLICKIFR